VTDRISSGSEYLDAVLGGGLLANSINVVMGLPGSGKTILAQEYLFKNASEGRPAVYLSTVSEPLEKILRYGRRCPSSTRTLSAPACSTRTWERA
jgi:circadian clock protein KaiC